MGKNGRTQTTGNLCEQLGSHADSWEWEPQSPNVRCQTGSPDPGQATHGLFLQVLSTSCKAAEELDKDQCKLGVLLCFCETLTYGTHFLASVSFCVKEATSWNKIRTKEQSITVLPHRIRYLSSITTLD